mgnify:CR=1 FL=1
MLFRSRLGADEIDPSVPMAVRADPFGAVRSVLMGPKGEVWMPIHGIFPKSKAKAAADAAVAYFDSKADLIAKHDIKLSLLTLASGIEIVRPQPDEIDFIGQAYQRILDDATRPDDADGLRSIARRLCRQDGVETILLAGTDLTALFDEASAGFPCLDVARLHIEAIVETLCDQRT